MVGPPESPATPCEHSWEPATLGIGSTDDDGNDGDDEWITVVFSQPVMHVDEVRVYQSGPTAHNSNAFVWKMALYSVGGGSSATHWVCSDYESGVYGEPAQSGDYLCDDKTSDMNTPFIPDTPWFGDLPPSYEGINMLRVWVSIDGDAPEGSTICIDAFEITGSSCQSPSMPPPSPPAPPTPPPMGCNGGWQDGSYTGVPDFPHLYTATEEECYEATMAAYPTAKYITW